MVHFKRLGYCDCPHFYYENLQEDFEITIYMCIYLDIQKYMQ